MTLLDQTCVVNKEKGAVNVGWIIYVGDNSIGEKGQEEGTERKT